MKEVKADGWKTVPPRHPVQQEGIELPLINLLENPLGENRTNIIKECWLQLEQTGVEKTGRFILLGTGRTRGTRGASPMFMPTWKN